MPTDPRQLEGYDKLSDEAKRIVITNQFPDFVQMSPAAQQVFLKGNLKPMPTPPPATTGLWDRAKAYVAETLGNVPADIGATAGNVYDLGKLAVQSANYAINPYRGTSLAPLPEPIKGMGRLALGTAESMVPFWNPDTPESRMAEQVGSQIGQAVRHPWDYARQRIKEHPVQSVMDLATLATGGGAVMESIPALSRAGKVVSKAGSLLDPVQQTMKVAGKLGSGVAEPVMTAMARKRYARALQPAGDLYESYWSSKAGLEAGIPLSAAPTTLKGNIVEGHWKVIDRAKALKDAANVQIDAIVNDLNKQGFIVYRDQIADDALAYLKKTYGSSDTAKKDLAKFENLAKEYKAELIWDPNMGGPGKGGYRGVDMNPMQAQEQKVILQHKADTAYRTGDVAAAESLQPNWHKAVAFEIRKKLEDWTRDPATGISKLTLPNQTSRNYGLLQQDLEKFVRQRIVNPKQPQTQWAWAGGRVGGTLGLAGIGALVGGAPGAALGGGAGAIGVLAALALGSPPISSRIAIMLNRAAKFSEAGGTALVKAAPILQITPATQIMSRLQPMPQPPPSLSPR